MRERMTGFAWVFSIVMCVGNVRTLPPLLATSHTQPHPTPLPLAREQKKAKAGNEHAKTVLKSWAEAEWFLSKPDVPDKITTTVFFVKGETNTDDLSPAPDAWSRPDIPLHGLAMLKIAREGIIPDQVSTSTD